MELTGNEPISVDNLAAALQAANLDREVLFAGTLKLVSESLVFDANLSDYEGFEVTISDKSGNDIETKVVPAADRQETTVCGVGVEPWQRMGNYLQIRFDENGHSSRWLSRIVGIRSGGGQLLADILAALEGVA